MSAPQVRLIYFNRDGQIRKIAIRKGTTVLGRRPDCDVRIPKPYVSRKHCRIVLEGDVPMVQDLGSANGTFVNREKIMEASVHPGDRLRVGPVTFTFQINGEPATVANPSQSQKVESAMGISGLMGDSAVHLDDDDEPLPPGLE